MASFNRPPRLISPLPDQVVKLPKIPALAGKKGSAEWLGSVLPFAAMLLTIVILFAFMGGGSSWTSYLLFLPMMGVSYLASLLISRQQKKENEKKLAAAHLRLKNDIYRVEKTLSDLSQEEKKKRLRKDPDFPECLKRAQNWDPRLGERRPEDDDFLHFRVGTGGIPASYQIQQEETEQEADEFIQEAKAIDELSKRYGTISDAPFLVQLPGIGALGICGDHSVSMTNTILCQTMTHHWPDEVRIAVICPPDVFTQWEWLGKAPHSSHLLSAMTGSLARNDPRKVTAALLKELELELQQREQTFEAKKLIKRDEVGPSQVFTPLPRLVIVFHEVAHLFNHPAASLLLEKGRDLGVYGIFLTDHPNDVPGGCRAVIRVQGEKLLYSESGINTLEWNADLTTRDKAEQFSEALAAVPFPSGGASSQPPEQVAFLKMFNAGRVEDIPVKDWWNGKNPYGYLRAPIGKTSPTSDWIFDLNDRDGAHGPHGLLGGMTGSGKSETLKAIILALAVTHHPYDLNFALVDFKGGAAFNELRNLPHTVGVITDIESNPTFAERVIQSLTGEIERRKKVLENARATFRFGRSHIDEYREKLRTRRPLPRLLIVFDEFAEFKNRNPGDSRKLIGIARQGRSLGVHLLLATQNIAAAIDPEIMQNSTYRICLRVSDPQDSVQMIGIPDAISLRRGRAYFSVTSRVLYQSAYSGADYIPDNLGAAVPNSIIRIHPDGKRDEVSRLAWQQPGKTPPKSQPATEAAAVVEYLAETARQMGLKKPPSVWQDALPERLYLPDILDQNITGGWDGNTWKPCRLLTDRENSLPTVYPYLGLYDNPQGQCQPYFQMDPAQSGHILIFGSAGSGKSTLLRTLVTSLAITNAPDQAHIYILDYGGQPRLKALETFPHVGSVITRLETERTERLIGYLTSEIVRRTDLMRKAKVDSWTDYNAHVKTGEQFPAIFLVIDGFLNLKDTFEPDVIKKIVMLVGGLSAGIHLAVSSYIQTDLPNELMANINSRISLYQAVPNEYPGLVGFLSEARLQEDAALGMRPGRGLLRSTTPLTYQAALPTHGENDKELAENLSALASSMRIAWAGRRGPISIQALEEFIHLPPVDPRKYEKGEPAEIGITYRELKPIGFSIAQDGSAFLVSSTAAGGGKTAFLQMWLLRLAEMYTPEQLEMKIIGYHSQSLAASKSLPGVQYIRHRQALEEFLNEMTKIVDTRIQEQEEQIRADAENFDQAAFMSRYPHIFIAIDDYARFSSSIGDNERARMIEILQKGDESGVSFVIADTMSDLPKSYQDNFIGKFSAAGCGVLLGGADGIDLFNNARITPGQPTIGLPPGRGYFIRRGRVSLFQAGVWWQQNENPAETFQSRMARLRKSPL